MEVSKEIIIENINNPNVLEDLYQSSKKSFSEIIGSIYNDDCDLIIKYWHSRLFYKPAAKKVNIYKYIFTAFLIILAWVPIRYFIISELFYYSYQNDYFYIIKAAPIIYFLMLSLFFIFNSLNLKKILFCIIPYLILYIY